MSAWPRRRVARHGLFWAAALGTNFLMQLPAYVALGKPLYISGLFLNQLPAGLLTVYPLLYVVLPQLLRGQRLRFLGLLAVWLLATVLVTNLTRTLHEFVLAPALLGSVSGRVFYWGLFLELSFTWFMLVVTAGGAAAIKLMNDWYAQRQLSEELRQRQLRTELELLKAQLQPAFLFGTLSALRGLTAAKSPAAPGAVLHLAELLRYLLYEGPRELVPLADEAAMLRHYVALEQLRLGTRVEVSLSVSGALDAHRIAPLLLLPLVENAFRHGTAPGLDCPWVSIDLVAKRHSIIFKIINAHDGFVVEEPGLASLRQRLARLYPDQQTLKIVAEPDSFLAVLSLELAPAPGRLRRIPA